MMSIIYINEAPSLRCVQFHRLTRLLPLVIVHINFYRYFYHRMNVQCTDVYDIVRKQRRVMVKRKSKTKKAQSEVNIESVRNVMKNIDEEVEKLREKIKADVNDAVLR